MMTATRYTPHSSRASTSAQPYDDTDDEPTQRFVVGKIDAGIAVLISDSIHLIEFPSLLLPPGVAPGSIVNISCTRNSRAEKQHARDFWDLQRDIADTFGAREPAPPSLRVRNTTQTSVTLEWDPLDLASAALLNLSIYRNGQRLTTIPNPTHNTSTKLSGLQLDTDYHFHLVLKTTAGTFSSQTVKTRTHTIDNTTGISVCFGLVEPRELVDQAEAAVVALGARRADKIQIETTHFVATSSASRDHPSAGPGVEYQKAVQLSIPIVSPEWLLACQRASKLVPIAPYYLGQTNRAASLSSAQLVASPPSQSHSLTSSSGAGAGAGAARGVRTVQAVAPSPSQPVVPTKATVPEEEEPAPAPAPASAPPADADAVPAPAPKPVLELQEDVEAPPPEQREPEPAPEQADEATDSSTRGIKSDDELRAAGGEMSDETAGLPAAALGGQDSTGDAAKEQEEEKPAAGAADLEVKPDAPGDELAQEQEEVPAPAAAPAATEAPPPVAAEEPQLDAAEAGESDVDADEVKEAETAEKGRAEEPGSKQDDDEEEDAAGETSLVDVTL
ncbi:hypothetical protein Rhopal_000855-T1 [Rhodotorula paludigena]|uniref:Chitin biosynthesis protein n=1 Tax=Rhodotorula paludigena TaxID=86838 RepID=A0AAV5GE27_9BASI|nr:hypothetical protein Rhopal_000855-T1 [Rhodotorula paludigena]